MSGAGNDFILVDNRAGVFDFTDIELCRKEALPAGDVGGADGLILIEEPDREGIDFRWRFFNADGSAASMCGNGARCAARLSFLLGISGRLRLVSHGGGDRARARSMSPGRVAIGMTDPRDGVARP